VTEKSAFNPMQKSVIFKNSKQLISLQFLNLGTFVLAKTYWYNLLLLLIVNFAYGAMVHHQDRFQMKMHGIYGSYPMQRDSTGSSWIPSSTKMPSIHQTIDEWFLMTHGFLMAIYDHQGGYRGKDKFFSENMLMTTSQKDFQKATFALRGMISLEPATIGCNGYPLLLQTGETCNGITPLIDRQHPHDFLMELAAVYTARFSSENSLFFYFGYPGEPALGPPAYIHRFSSFFNPEAPITHHWLDSTHIVFGVATLGYVHNWLKIDGSIFTGREPDQHRWNFDKPRFDSYSARLSFNPTENIALQISYGLLKKPEILQPNINTYRTTASFIYNKSWRNNNWQITAAWGLNRNVNAHSRLNLNGYLLESAIEINNKHVIFGRGEYVAKDELFISPNKIFKVGKLDLGYLFEFPLLPYSIWGVGFVASASFVPHLLKPEYGNTPLSYMVFIRIELYRS
jgi:hypothetical protein